MSSTYPSQVDVLNAIQNSNVSIRDPFLKSYTFVMNKLGRPLSYSGGYSIVFPFQNGNKKLAVRCWIAGIDDIEIRLHAISNYLKQVNSAYFVGFEYVNNGILIDGRVYPFVRMDWVDGLTIKDYVQKHLNDVSKLDNLAENFVIMCVALHQLGISHGDLQHGNIIVRPDDSIVLIDYDSVFVPTLKGMNQVIAGLESYQHPLRKTLSSCGPHSDYFSELIIYLSIKVLSQRPDLWYSLNLEKKDNSFLFTAEDLSAPQKSSIHQEISRLGRSFSFLSNQLLKYLVQNDIEAFKPIESVVHEANKLPWDDKQPKKALTQPLPEPKYDVDIAGIQEKWKKKEL